MLAPIELAYIAAFVDGEGCITLLKKERRKAQHNDAFTPHVSVSNTYLPILNWMRGITGLGLVNPKTDGKPNRKAQWVWFLRTEEVAPFLESVRPYLRIKMEQADLVLEFLNLDKGFDRWSGGVPDNIAIQRQLIWEDLRELNKRGTS